MQQTVTTRDLLSYLPPNEVVWEFVVGAVAAFVVVQLVKLRMRQRPGRYLNRFEMAMYAAIVAGAQVTLMLYVTHGYPAGKALAYGLQGGILAPIIITVLLSLLERFAPELRQKLSQDRRRRSGAPPSGVERRDETTRFL